MSKELERPLWFSGPGAVRPRSGSRAFLKQTRPGLRTAAPGNGLGTPVKVGGRTRTAPGPHEESSRTAPRLPRDGPGSLLGRSRQSLGRSRTAKRPHHSGAARRPRLDGREAVPGQLEKAPGPPPGTARLYDPWISENGSRTILEWPESGPRAAVGPSSCGPRSVVQSSGHR